MNDVELVRVAWPPISKKPVTFGPAADVIGLGVPELVVDCKSLRWVEI
jgi:hypothetical protein